MSFVKSGLKSRPLAAMEGTMKIDWRKGELRNASMQETGEDSCVVCLNSAGGGISLPQLLETDDRYVIGDVEVLEDHSAAMMFRCFEKGADREKLYLRFGLLPHFQTRICLDLSLLDNSTIYTNRTPGTLKLVCHGHRMKRKDVKRFELGIEKVYHDVRVRLSGFYTSNEKPEEFPIPDKKIVDEFGQWKEKEWPGKIHSMEELKKELQAQEGPAAYPFPSWNRWGGDSTRKLKEGSGFFSTIKTEDGRWHLVDPDGCDYFSLGPCGTRPGDGCRVDGFEKVCDWLPEEDDPEWKEFYQKGVRQRTAYMQPEHFKMLNFAGVNMKRIYGDDWKKKWEEIAMRSLKGSGINSQGNFPGLHVNDGHDSLPYVRELPGFPMTKTLIFRDFPDVLSEEYQRNAEIYAKQLEEWKDDPWLIGYFLRNEPEFNFVEDLAIADEVLRNPEDTFCRRGLIRFLKERYGSVEALNEVWGTAFSDFSELEKPIEGCMQRFPGAEKDLREYSVFLIREYSRVPAEACRKVDHNHLNLGLRWSKAYNRDMMAGWEYFDVFSINCYDFDPTKDMNFVKDAGVDLPILMGEFHCGALDRGLTATGLKGVTDQNQRAVMFRHYVEKVAQHPYGVGAHWFQYNDQFCLGRFDGENYQIGMVDICMQPERELMEAALQTGKVLYEVKNGEKAAFEQLPVSIPMIGY